MGIIVDTFDSPLGMIRLCSEGEYLTALVFDGQKYIDRHLPKEGTSGTCSVLEDTKLWLTEFFLGNVPKKSPPLKPAGTDFQQRVWHALCEIPYGETVTYGELANRLGCKSAQAVGGAVGKNPISILIPCHRVVGANGSLTGYAGGIEKKVYLLELEKI